MIEIPTWLLFVLVFSIVVLFIFNQELNNLPKSLLYLAIHDKYQHQLPNIRVEFSSIIKKQ